LNSDFAARWPRGELSANGNATAERFVLIIGALTIANGIAFNLGHSAAPGGRDIPRDRGSLTSRDTGLTGRAAWRGRMVESEIDLKDINVNSAISAETSATADSMLNHSNIG
jgi:hypothetical protein